MSFGVVNLLIIKKNHQRQISFEPKIYDLQFLNGIFVFSNCQGSLENIKVYTCHIAENL